MSKMNVTLTPNNINLSRVNFSSTISKEEISKLAQDSKKIEDKPLSIKQDVNLKKSSFSLKNSIHTNDNFIYFSNPIIKDLNIDINKDFIIYTPDGKLKIQTDSTEFPAKDLEPYRDIIQNATKIIIPDGIEKIGQDAFRECKNLKEISLPETVSEIGTWAFADCEKLERINIPDKVTRIHGWTFCNCINLKEIILPQNCMIVDNKAFDNCINLKRLFCNEDVTFVEHAISSCGNLRVYLYHKK